MYVAETNRMSRVYIINKETECQTCQDSELLNYITLSKVLYVSVGLNPGLQSYVCDYRSYSTSQNPSCNFN